MPNLCYLATIRVVSYEGCQQLNGTLYDIYRLVH